MSAARIVAVCTGSGGIPKREVQRARVDVSGLVGDGHRSPAHGGPERAVCLFSREIAEELGREGVRPTRPGDFGENLLCEGVDLSRLRLGARLHVGDEVVLRVRDVREPCGALSAIDPRFPDLLVGRSGLFCTVEAGGEVRAGDALRVEQAPATAEFL